MPVIAFTDGALFTGENARRDAASYLKSSRISDFVWASKKTREQLEADLLKSNYDSPPVTEAERNYNFLVSWNATRPNSAGAAIFPVPDQPAESRIRQMHEEDFQLRLTNDFNALVANLSPDQKLGLDADVFDLLTEAREIERSKAKVSDESIAIFDTQRSYWETIAEHLNMDV